MRAGQGPSHRCCRRHRPPGAAGAQRRLRTASLLQADWPACMQLSVQRLEAERAVRGGGQPSRAGIQPSWVHSLQHQ